MQTTKITFLLSGIVFVTGLIGALLGGQLLQAATPASTKLGGATDSIAFMQYATSSSQTVTTSSSRVLATSSEAQVRIFQNNGPFTVYLRCASDKPALANQGILLVASSTFKMSLDGSDLCRGSVTAISTGGNTQVLVNQY